MRVSDSETQFVDKAGLDHAISELKELISKIDSGEIDLSDYVTKEELQSKLDSLHIDVDLSAYTTKEELTTAISNIDLSSYALKADIPTVPTKVSELSNDSGYLTAVPDEYVTDSELEAKGYLTEHQDLSAYAKKTDIPSLDGYATETYVDNAVANIPSGGGTADLSNYYTKDQVYSKEETDALIPTVTDGKDGITPHIDSTTKHWMIGDSDTGVVAEGVNGKDGTNGSDGKDGTDGISPTVTVTKEGSVATITCTDVNGTTTATISDGKDGTSSGGSSGGGGSTDVYSTEETAVGTWIDGKTIYRKVIQVGKLPKVESGYYDFYNYSFSDNAVDQIVSMDAILKSGDTHICVHGCYNMIMLSNFTINNYNEGLVQLISNNGLSVRLWYGKLYGNYDCNLIVEYTKNA